MRGYSRIFKKAALALAALALCTAGQTYRYEPDQTAPTGPVLVGSVVHVSDGDTIKVQLSSGPITVRFSFIDAPEWNQPWGPEATAALKARLTGKQVQLAVETQDKYDRLVAVVYLGDENINAWMVKQGHAWAYRQYLENPAYCGWEGHARASKLGLWGVTPANWRAPWDWRHVANGQAAGFTDYSRDTIASCIAAMRPAGSLSAGHNTCCAQSDGFDTGIRLVPHQGQHQRQRTDLPRAREHLVRPHANQHGQRRALVLHGEGRARCRLEGAEELMLLWRSVATHCGHGRIAAHTCRRYRSSDCN